MAKRLESADTHWPRESKEKTMTTQSVSRELIKEAEVKAERELEVKPAMWNMQISPRPTAIMLTLACHYRSANKQYLISG